MIVCNPYHWENKTHIIIIIIRYGHLKMEAQNMWKSFDSYPLWTTACLRLLTEGTMNKAYCRICPFHFKPCRCKFPEFQTKPLSVLVFFSFAPPHGSSNSKSNQVSTSKWNFNIKLNFHVLSLTFLLLSEVIVYDTHILTTKLPRPASSRLDLDP